MLRTFCLLGALFVSVTAYGDEQITIQKVTVNTPSGVITGHVVGTGDQLMFIDDTDTSKSYTLSRGSVRTFKSESGDLIVELARPEPMRVELSRTSALRSSIRRIRPS
jgi:hypothetical protein